MDRFDFYIKQFFFCIGITLLMSLDFELLNYGLALAIVYFIYSRDENYFFFALTIALASINADTSVPNSSLDQSSFTLGYNVSLGFINISLPEIFFLTLIAFSFQIDHTYALFYKIILLFILAGGFIVSINAYKDPTEVISGWSGGIRSALVPFSIFGGIFVIKEFNGLHPLKFLSTVILTFFVNAVLFSRYGHLIFIASTCVAATIFFSEGVFFILSILFFATIFSVNETTTFTVLLTYFIPLVVYISRSRIDKLFAHISFIAIFLAFLSLFIYVLIHLDSFYNRFYQADEQVAHLFEDPEGYFIYKLGDRITLWKPFLEQFIYNPYQMIYYKSIPYINILGDESRELEWTTHAHNTFITLLYYYGPVFGYTFIFLILKVIFDSVRTINIMVLEKSVFFNAILFSIFPGLLFGYFPVDFQVGYIYFLIAGVLIFSRENLAYRSR